MPLTNENARAHLTKAHDNFRTYLTLTDESQQDWAVVLLFYTTLHLFHAHFTETLTGFDQPRTHDQRHSKVLLLFPNLYRHYRTLHDVSVQCRYYFYSPTIAEATRFYEREYIPIIQSLSALPHFGGVLLPSKPTP